ncbi:hypothetical protein [Streptomyces sp. NPDC012616]|uniref:hypothetical protein n=1 Tax=Streptomyces sp. NPDC012616 TaxID=3364840 RepID=UPI0036EA2ED4
MPSYDTPEPVSVTAYVYAGSIQFTAGDRLDTVVEVRPRDPKKDLDVRTADQTEVRCTSGILTVTTPKANLLGRGGTVDVTVELPAGSSIDVTGAGVRVLGEGRLGEVRVKTSAGDVRLDTTGPLPLKASHGSTVVDRVEGRADITSSTGDVRVGLVDGPAVLKPITMLLLFVYIFGDVMSAGIGGGGADRSDYIAYIVPGILMMTIGSTVIGAAVHISMDMTEGLIAGFRTMPVYRGSVIVGHVVGSVLQCLASVVLVGVAIGFRSTDATVLEWLAAFGLRSST